MPNCVPQAEIHPLFQPPLGLLTPSPLQDGGRIYRIPAANAASIGCLWFRGPPGSFVVGKLIRVHGLGCICDSCLHVVFIAPLLKVLVLLNGCVCLSVQHACVIIISTVKPVQLHRVPDAFRGPWRKKKKGAVQLGIGDQGDRLGRQMCRCALWWRRAAS